MRSCRPVRRPRSKWSAATWPSSKARTSPTDEVAVELEEAGGRARDVLLPMPRRVLVGALPRVFWAGEPRALELAGLRQCIGLHVDDIAGRPVVGRRERVAGAADGLWQVRENAWKLERRGKFVERRLAVREAERADVHVAVHEAPARDKRASGDPRAARGPEVQDERRARAFVPQAHEVPRQR